MSEKLNVSSWRVVVPVMVAMGCGFLASQLLPLGTVPKTICVGLIAGTVLLLVSAITRPKQTA